VLEAVVIKFIIKFSGSKYAPFEAARAELDKFVIKFSGSKFNLLRLKRQGASSTAFQVHLAQLRKQQAKLHGDMRVVVRIYLVKYLVKYL
jgi:hypothetical protein